MSTTNFHASSDDLFVIIGWCAPITAHVFLDEDTVAWAEHRSGYFQCFEQLLRFSAPTIAQTWLTLLEAL